MRGLSTKIKIPAVPERWNLKNVSETTEEEQEKSKSKTRKMWESRTRSVCLKGRRTDKAASNFKAKSLYKHKPVDQH